MSVSLKVLEYIYVYVQAEAVLNKFLNERGPEANSILYTDTKLTENDRKIQGKSLSTYEYL